MTSPFNPLETLAKAVVEALKEVSDTERYEFLHILKQSFCLKCGDGGPESSCYCDYQEDYD